MALADFLRKPEAEKYRILTLRNFVAGIVILPLSPFLIIGLLPLALICMFGEVVLDVYNDSWIPFQKKWKKRHLEKVDKLLGIPNERR